MMTQIIAEREIRMHGDPACGNWVIQLTGSHEADALDAEAAAIDAAVGQPQYLIAVPVSSWNDDLSPQPSAPVFGKEGFGGGAGATLAYLTDELLPALTEIGSVKPAHICLAGYSLAGLFALWASTQTDAFDAVASASPSVWFPGWLAYAEDHPLQAGCVFLSLGDREAKTRHPVLSTVADCIQRQHDQLKARGVCTTLQWNPGNHFVDADKRTAAAIAWTLNQS